MTKPISTEFFDILPTPVLIAELSEENLNHKVIFLNKAFGNELGWTLDDIPDKNNWWEKAYPDPSYQKVAERLWELGAESATANKDNFVTVTVNIMTKHSGTKRFKVNAELKNALLDGYYIVTFEKLASLQEV